MNEPSNKQAQISISLHDDDREKLEQVAKSERLSRSAAARRCVSDWLREHAPERVKESAQ